MEANKIILIQDLKTQLAALQKLQKTNKNIINFLPNALVNELKKAQLFLKEEKKKSAPKVAIFNQLLEQAPPNWIDNGDGTFTAKKGANAWDLARIAKITPQEAIQILEEQGYNIYTDGDVKKVAINPNDVVTVFKKQDKEDEKYYKGEYPSFDEFLEHKGISPGSRLFKSGISALLYGGAAQGIGTTMQGATKLNPWVLGAAFFLGTWKEQSNLMHEWRKSMTDEEKKASKRNYDRGVEILKSIKGDYYE
jgi:hypothetical protein